MLWDKMAHAKELVTHLPLEVINTLGKVEHSRWNAYHILNGWKAMSIEELEQKVQHLQGHEAKSGMQKDKTRKLQACMVGWEELDKVSKVMEHDYKSDDIETIIRIAAMNDAIKSNSGFFEKFVLNIGLRD